MILRPRSFRAKLLWLFVPLFAATQFFTWLIVSRFHEAEARSGIDASLQRAALTFQRLVDYRNKPLIAGAKSAARDYAIKPLFVDGDTDTLASALKSVQRASDSDLVVAVTLEARALAWTSPVTPAPGLLAQLIALAEADPRPDLTAAGYGFFDGKFYSLVIAPVRAPDKIAWLVIGFRIDREFAEDLKQLTDVDLSFFDPAGQALASTLPDVTLRDLAAALPYLASTTGRCEPTLGGEKSLVRTLPLQTGDRHSATLALQYSLDEKLAPARKAELKLLLVAGVILVVAMLLSVAFARRLTRPIDELVGQTRRIAQGDYRVQPTSYRADELGRLAEAFDHMARGLDERDRVRDERDRDRDLLDKNVSPEIAAQLRRDGSALGGELRDVTVLFADLRGFTTLSEKLPPKELLALLNRYFDCMSAAIDAQGGVIDKFIGDAIMALFGAPVAQGDAADRALAAALAMERALVALNAELAAEGIAPLAIGLGVNTARVVAGNIGSHRRLNYSVIGDGVNLAARLQAETRKAEYRTNLITSAATLAAARDPTRFTARPLGAVQVKGRAQPVEIFAVAG